MLHAARSVPVVAGERTLRIRPLIDARRTVRFAPGWYASFVKAIGIVSMRLPELRRAYLPYPWPRLYEHPHSVASVIFDRVWNGEHATFLCPVRHPERMELGAVQAKLKAFQDDPIEAHGPLRRLVRNARYPRPVRRALWWAGLNWHGALRAGYFGTVAVNSVAGLRSRMNQFVTPITSVLYVGSPNPDGTLVTQLAFDHRVFDGYIGARVGMELENVLNTEIAAEIRALADRAPRAAA